MANRKNVRVVAKNSSPRSAAPGKSAGKTTLGNTNKAIRDGANASARTGKKPAASANDFGGELLIEGKISPEVKKEILAIARNTGKTGPNDAERVTKIEDKGGKMHIRTSGPELAVSIGKRVHHSHKGGKLTIVWGKDEAPVRVHWTAKG